MPDHQDEQVFRAETVTSMGQVIGVVLAADRATAQRAARRVKVTYEDLPAVITIEVRWLLLLLIFPPLRVSAA